MSTCNSCNSCKYFVIEGDGEFCTKFCKPETTIYAHNGSSRTMYWGRTNTFDERLDNNNERIVKLSKNRKSCGRSGIYYEKRETIFDKIIKYFKR
jgi:hypothetical protein